MDVKRTVEGAADIYLDRLRRGLALGDRLADAKSRALTIAVAWLDSSIDRAKWQPRIEAVLTRRLRRDAEIFLPDVIPTSQTQSKALPQSPSQRAER